MVDLVLFLSLAKMLCNLWVLVGSAIHNVHNTIKGFNTGTSWISADGDSKLGKCVCSTVCMHADSADLQWLLPMLIFAGLIFALFSFSAKYAKIRPLRKKGLYSTQHWISGIDYFTYIIFQLSPELIT